jgi:hypothetical protein
MFTPAQYARLMDLRRRAWLVECDRTGTPLNSRPSEDAWYRQVLFSALHARTTKGCNRTLDFDLVMMALAVEANDDGEITYWSGAVSRRFIFLITARLAKIARATGRPHDWAYVVAIMAHMGLPAAIEDVPAELMRNVFIALDRHDHRTHEAMLVREDAGPAAVHHTMRSEWGRADEEGLPF